MGMSLRRSGYLGGRGGCGWDGVQAGTKKVLLGQTVMCPKATTYVLVLSHGGSGEPLEVWGRGSASEQRPWGLALSISLAKSRSLRQASAGAFDPAQIGGRISAASPSLQGPKETQGARDSGQGGWRPYGPIRALLRLQRGARPPDAAVAFRARPRAPSFRGKPPARWGGTDH